MKTYKEIFNHTLTEQSEKVITAKLYIDDSNHEMLYTKTDGKGRYPLSRDGSVHLSDDKPGVAKLSIDGKPHYKGEYHDVMEIDGKLGVWDYNLKLIYKLKNKSELKGFEMEWKSENWEGDFSEDV